MARKSAAVLEKDPIKKAFAEYETSLLKLEAAWAESDKLYSTKTANNLRKGVTIEEYKASLHRIAEVQRATFGWLDRWHYLVEHQNDPPTEPQVPEEEVRSIIGLSLSDKLPELKFSLNYGLLASKVAQAIRMDVTEDSLEAPLCGDCG